MHPWRGELIALRSILLETELKEELKWSVPCYTLNGKNVLILCAFKDHATLNMFKGSLIDDKYNLLTQPGESSQAGRQMRFTSVESIEKNRGNIAEYIQQAIDIEKAGKKVEFIKNPEPMPEELIERLEEDRDLRDAFAALTPGRQRGYIIYFSQAKQASTRYSRIDKKRADILAGKGMMGR